jgi:serine/threonine protein kinase/HAMP domain-containing protein
MPPPSAIDPEATVVRPMLVAAVDPDATVVRPLLAKDGTVVKPLAGTSALPPLPAGFQRGGASPLALAPGTRLFEYRIDRVLGQGGFGITYLATDVHLKAQVAIKEYLPEEIAFRAGDHSVSPNAARHKDRYREGLEAFLVEARTLAALRHPAIVRVARFFEAHRTAYMVLEYEKGQPFKTWWPAHHTLGEAGLLERLLPLLDGLAAVHAAGFLHRDIKPDNIQVREDDGRLVLLDFGSAGQALTAGGEAAVIVTPGYAPLEQYGLGDQGPWTDVYALSATLYWAVTGQKPPDAETRAADPGAYRPVATVAIGSYGAAFLRAIDAALATDPRERPQDVPALRAALAAEHVGSLRLHEALSRDDTAPGALDGSADTQPSRGARLRHLAARWLLPRHWPLAFKLTAALLLSAVLPMALTLAWNLQAGLAALEAGELRAVEQSAHSTAGRIAQFLTDSAHLTRALASDTALAAFLAHPNEATGQELTLQLALLATANPDVRQITLLDAQGQVLIASDASVLGRNFNFRRYFQAAAAGQSFAGGMTLGVVDGDPTVFFAEPVRAQGPNAPVLGVLAVRVRGASVDAILSEVRHDSHLQPFMIDGDGVLIHHSRPERLYRSLLPLAAKQLAALREDQRFGSHAITPLGETELAAAMLGAKGTGHVSYTAQAPNEPVITGYSPVAGGSWVVGVTTTRAEFEAPLRRLFWQALASMGLAALVFAGLGLRFARSVVNPIRALTRAAEALKSGNFEPVAVETRRRDEVGQLARTFNVMVDVLRQRERERRRD